MRPAPIPIPDPSPVVDWDYSLDSRYEAGRRRVLPAGPVRVAIEAGIRHGWDRWLFGERGKREKSGFVKVGDLWRKDDKKLVFDRDLKAKRSKLRNNDV